MRAIVNEMPAVFECGWCINIAGGLWSDMLAARFVLLASAIVAGGLLSQPFPSRSMGYPGRERQSALQGSLGQVMAESIEPRVLEPPAAQAVEPATTPPATQAEAPRAVEPATTPPAAQAVALAVESATTPVEEPVNEWICVADPVYGRLSNQLLEITQALSLGASLRIDTYCRYPQLTRIRQP